MRILTLLFFVSCASSTYILNKKDILPYKEKNTLTQIDKEIKTFKIAQIRDLRKNTHYGMAYTGVEYLKTPIIIDGTLETFIKDFFEDAFEMRKINTSNDSHRELKIDIKEIWVEEVIEKFKPERAKCRVDIVFHLENEKLKWNGNYWTEYMSAGDLSDGTQRLAPTLASCLNQVVEKLVNDEKFINLLL